MENAISEIKIDGYQIKNKTLLYVILYKINDLQFKTARSHKEFKQLYILLLEDFSIKQIGEIPEGIKQNMKISKASIVEKIEKYNKFLQNLINI